MVAVDDYPLTFAAKGSVQLQDAVHRLPPWVALKVLQHYQTSYKIDGTVWRRTDVGTTQMTTKTMMISSRKLSLQVH